VKFEELTEGEWSLIGPPLPPPALTGRPFPSVWIVLEEPREVSLGFPFGEGKHERSFGSGSEHANELFEKLLLLI